MNQVAIPLNDNIQPVREVPGWLILSIDNLKLAIPQKDASTIELASALEVSVDGEAEAGWLDRNGRMWPAYSLGAHLELQEMPPRTRRFCIMFDAGDKQVGLLCDQIRMLPSDDDLSLQAMPECMANEESPLQWLSLLEGNMVAAAKSGGIVKYMAELEARYGSD
ncbi:MAG: hypothetical protein OEZ10_12895 [Gammaproteobacteria bacterium]|nr:hypothetical protein [Gammaproteobacteria bacterium]